MSFEQSTHSSRKPKQKSLRVIAVTAGKGGVGKTNVSANLSIALAKTNHNVLLLDADLSLANVDVLLGLQADKNIEHVIRGECQLKDIVMTGPQNIKVVPGASGASILTHLSHIDLAGFIHAFDEIYENFDTMIVDTPSGISENVASFLRASQDIIVVVCNEPTSITDAYALMKVMSQEYGIRNFHLLANMVHTLSEGRELYNRLSQVTNDYLDVSLDYMGAIPFDEHLRRAVKQQRSVYELFPNCEAANAFSNVAKHIDDWPCSHTVANSSPFFMEKLLERESW